MPLAAEQHQHHQQGARPDHPVGQDLGGRHGSSDLK
jgi:hypothetical protein